MVSITNVLVSGVEPELKLAQGKIFQSQNRSWPKQNRLLINNTYGVQTCLYSKILSSKLVANNNEGGLSQPRLIHAAAPRPP